MSWPEISIEDFPPERDDEPASLRQDILDELTDHFACALNRELLKNPDQQLARERVKKQFGDPIKIARQLWFDAMKEKIMSQRIMAGVSVVLAVCCIAVVGIAWSMMKESQAINQSLVTQLAAIADRPEPVAAVNQDQEILKQLDELKQAQSDQNKSSSEEMNSISFQLVQEGNIEKPAVGFSGRLTKSGSKTDSFSLSVVSDESGKLDFGKLPWGNYSLILRSPWSGNVTESSFTTIPGRGYTQTITCPAVPTEEVPVQFQVNQTVNKEGEWDYLLCDFRHRNPKTAAVKYVLTSSRKVNDLAWTFSDDLQKDPEQGVYLIDMKNNQVIPSPLTAEGKYEDINLQTLTWQSSIKIRQGQYSQPAIYLLRKSELPKLSELNSLKPFGFLTISSHGVSFGYSTQVSMGMFVDPFDKLRIEPRHLNTLKLKYGTDAVNDIHGVRSIHSILSNHYVAVKEQSNVWEIKIPQMQVRLPKSGSLSKAR